MATVLNGLEEFLNEFDEECITGLSMASVRHRWLLRQGPLSSPSYFALAPVASYWRRPFRGTMSAGKGVQ